VFLTNRYTNIYYALCQRAQSRIPQGYTEKHHIMPASLGGDNTATNLAVLYPREHCLAHLCLVRMTEGNAHFKMVCAAKYLMECVVGKRLQCKINSRTFARIREQHAVAMSVLMKGRPKSPEACAKMSEAKRGSKLSLQACIDRTGKKRGPYSPRTEEHKQHISEARKQNWADGVYANRKKRATC
jgi:hypothetical protein